MSAVPGSTSYGTGKGAPADSPRLAALNVYPIKGCRGIAVDSATVQVTGLEAKSLCDREWMVVDRNGRFLTQREHPRLALVVPEAVDGHLRLSGADCASLDLALDATPEPSSDVIVWHAHVRGFDQGDEAAAWFSAFLRAPVRLVRFDRATLRRCNPDYAGASGAHTFFSDGYPLLVVGERSLDDLNERLRAKGSPVLPMNRFRPNIVLSGIPAYDEDHVDTIACGGVTLRLVKPCVRFQVTTNDQASARVGVEPLPTLSMYRRDDRLAGVTFGMNAIVVGGAGRAVAVGAPADVALRF